MDDKIDQAVSLLLAKVRANSKTEEDLRVTQAALNLAHVKQLLTGLTRNK